MYLTNVCHLFTFSYSKMIAMVAQFLNTQGKNLNGKYLNTHVYIQVLCIQLSLGTIFASFIISIVRINELYYDIYRDVCYDLVLFIKIT